MRFWKGRISPRGWKFCQTIDAFAAFSSMTPLQLKTQGWKLLKFGVGHVWNINASQTSTETCSYLCWWALTDSVSTWNSRCSPEMISAVMFVDDPWSSPPVRLPFVQFYMGCLLGTTKPGLYILYILTFLFYVSLRSESLATPCSKSRSTDPFRSMAPDQTGLKMFPPAQP